MLQLAVLSAINWVICHANCHLLPKIYSNLWELYNLQCKRAIWQTYESRVSSHRTWRRHQVQWVNRESESFATETVPHTLLWFSSCRACHFGHNGTSLPPCTTKYSGQQHICHINLFSIAFHSYLCAIRCRNFLHRFFKALCRSFSLVACFSGFSVGASDKWVKLNFSCNERSSSQRTKIFWVAALQNVAIVSVLPFCPPSQTKEQAQKNHKFGRKLNFFYPIFSALLAKNA